LDAQSLRPIGVVSRVVSTESPERVPSVFPKLVKGFTDTA